MQEKKLRFTQQRSSSSGIDEDEVTSASDTSQASNRTTVMNKSLRPPPKNADFQ